MISFDSDDIIFYISLPPSCRTKPGMTETTMKTDTQEKGVQAILRMPRETYEAIGVAARRRHMSFNQFAVETLKAAAMPEPEPKIKISELKPDPELESFIIHDWGLTDEEIKEDPRLSAILGL